MKFVRIFWAALREIFDEAAYERFLTQHADTSSRKAYWHFLEERRSAQERKPRCC